MIDPDPDTHLKKFKTVMYDLFDLDPDAFISALHELGCYDDYVHIDDIDEQYVRRVTEYQ